MGDDWISPGSFALLILATAWLASLLGAAPLPAILTVLTTPAWLYGTIFWEHAPACALTLLGVCLLLSNWWLLAGLTFGLAISARPESALFLGALLIVLREWRNARVLVVAGLVAGGLGVILGGGGEHLAQNYDSTADFLASRWRTASGMTKALLTGFPALAGLLLLRPEARARQLLFAAILFIGASLLLAPNDGGNQWGARYLLVVYPLAACLLFLPGRSQVARVAIPVLLLASLGVQAWAARDFVATLDAKESALQWMSNADVVLTDAWFVPQEAAKLRKRTILLDAPLPPLSEPSVIIVSGGLPDSPVRIRGLQERERSTATFPPFTLKMAYLTTDPAR